MKGISMWKICWVLQFLSKALKYAQYHFKNKLWNVTEMLEYLRTCCFSKILAFNAIEAFQLEQEYHGSDVWWMYEEIGIDILDFANTPMHLWYMGIKEYIISIIPTPLKQRLRQNQDFVRLASKLLDLCRENAQIYQQRWIHQYERLYQAFRRVSLSVYSHFDRILNEDQLKYNSYKSFT